MLTTTWRRRLATLRTGAHRTGLAAGVTSCSVVAATTIWGWLFEAPADIAIPARSAVNRPLLPGSSPQDCVANPPPPTQPQQPPPDACGPAPAPARLPPPPAVLVESTSVAAVTLQDDRGDTQQ